MSLFFYQLFIKLYPFAIAIAAFFNPKARLWIEGRKQTRERLLNGLSQLQRPVWIHCSSLGEFEQARPLIEKLKSVQPQLQVVVTFFSPSGYEVQKNYVLADAVMYLPMDSAYNARLFIQQINPALAIFVKYEYWYYFLKEISNKRIPLLLVSGIFRPDQPFFKWYGGLHRKMLSYFSYFFVQNQISATLLEQLGLKNVAISGDTRFDRVIDIASRFEPIPLVEKFTSGYKTLVAGSTWLEDDKELNHLANSSPDLRFIIAPHNIDESRISECLQLYKYAVRYSQLLKMDEASIESKTNTVIIDNIGMLSRLYYYATIALVGGGFAGDGVHNVLEPAVYGKPVIHGPVYHKYKEASDLVATGGSFEVGNAVELESIIQQLLENESLYGESSKVARNYVLNNAGAANAVTTYIKSLLKL